MLNRLFNLVLETGVALKLIKTGLFATVMFPFSFIEDIQLNERESVARPSQDWGRVVRHEGAFIATIPAA